MKRHRGCVFLQLDKDLLKVAEEETLRHEIVRQQQLYDVEKLKEDKEKEIEDLRKLQVVR